MRERGRRLASALRLGAVLAAGGLFFVVSGAAASSSTGYDIAYPQCNGAFPASPGFGIVGVNDGLPFSANPCLGTGSGPSELQWAGMSAGLYANTANPGPLLSSHWPNGQTSPKQCNTTANPGSNTAECTYDYGWNAAADSYQDAVNAYVALGWATAGAIRTPVANAWWLDVESANSWTTNTSFNVDELQGEAEYLKSVGAASVGFYANASDWQTITGNTSSLAAYPSWVPGAGSLSQAQAMCGGPGITGGGIALTQYPSGGFDGDYQCATTPPPPPAGSLSFASAGQTLTAGSTSAALSIALSQAATSATSVAVTTNSSGGTFATSPSGPWSTTLTLPVAAGATSTPSFYYSDTRAGQPVLTASASGYASATQTETVTAAALSTITVTPASARIRVGSQATFSASGTDGFGNAVSINPTWSISPSLGSFSSTQGTPVTFTGKTSGTGTITAAVGSVSGQAAITVTTKHPQGQAAPAVRTPATPLVGARAGQPTRLPARPGG